MSFELKPLPFAENALEPHMSARTIQFHYGKHHKAYVDTLNKLVENTPLEKKSLQELVRDLAGQRGQRPRKIFNNAGQVWNHEFFWESMAPPMGSNGGGGQPEGALAHMIETSFGGYDAFKALFKKTALDQFGSGWTWLIAEGDKLAVVGTANAMSPMAEGKPTLIGCDLWEHAYYLDYQNQRGAFVDVFLDRLVSWNAAAARLKGADVKEPPRAMRA
ncbi:MAG TPA: superoxide dismutase [Candidatus Cybelea sp.]|nr:superoxide dismutase [Candidatus Cybelea sp.]